MALCAAFAVRHPSSVQIWRSTRSPRSRLLALQAVVFAGLMPLSKGGGARGSARADGGVLFYRAVFGARALVAVPRFPDEAMIVFFSQLGFALAVVVYAVEFCMFWRLD